MGKLIKLAIVGALLYGAYLAFLQPEWVTVGSAAEGFTVDFPTMPSKETQRMNLRELGAGTVVAFNGRDEWTAFSAVKITSRVLEKSDLPRVAKEDSAEEVMKRLFKGRVINNTESSHRGVAFREVELRRDDKSSTIHCRIFVNNGEIYLFAVLSPTVTDAISGKGRFFRSIRFYE